MKHSNKNRLKILPILSLIILPYLIFSVVGILLMNKQHRANQIEWLWQEAKTHENDVSDFFLKRKTEILFLSRIASLQKLKIKTSNVSQHDQKQLKKTFEAFINNGSTYHAFYFLDATGKTLVQALKHSDNRTWVRNEKLALKTIKAFFKDALSRKKDEVFISPIQFHSPHVSLPAHYEPIIYLATPVFTSRNKPLGLFIGEVSVKQFLNDFKKLASKFKATPFLSTQNGNYITHNIANKEWGAELKSNENVNSDFSPEIAAQLLSGKPGSFKDNQNQIGVFLPVFYDNNKQDTFWVIGFTAKSKPPLSILSSYQKEITIFLLMFILTLVFIGFFYSRYLAAERKLEEVQNEFNSILTHELRSPLTNIKAAIDLLKKKGSFPTKLNNVLDRTSHIIINMSKLINDFLDLSKLEARITTLQLSSTDLKSLIDKVTNSFVDRSKMNNVLLEVEICKELPTLNIDAAKIERVVMNLVDNAFKNTPEYGKVIIKATQEKSSWIRVSISDTGSGIRKNEINKVFRKYEQTVSSKGSGTGLGLPIVKEIVEAHGGMIGVDSTVGKGSTFYFKLRSEQQRG